MRRFLVGAVLSAGMFASAGTAAQAASGFECTVGGSGTYTLDATAGGSDHVVLTNAAGAKISVSASLGNPAESGSLFFSPGSTVLTFPSGTSAEISGALSGTNLMLLANDGAVTVTLVCNPGSTASKVPEQPIVDAATSTAMAREASHQQLLKLLEKPLAYNDSMSERDLSAELAAFRNLTGTVSERDAMLEEVFFAEYTLYRIWRDYAKSRGDQAAVETQQHNIDNLMDRYDQARNLNAALGYLSIDGASTSATAAIDRAVSASNTIENTFSLLGYGPTGGFEGDAVLLQTENLVVALSAVGAISQTDLASGDVRSLSGRVNLNMATAISPRLKVGLGLGLGATSEDGPALGDRAYHYLATGVLSYALTPDLSLNGGLGYELTAHNYTVGTARGEGPENLFSGNLGASGKIRMPNFLLTPSVDMELAHMSRGAITLSDGSVLNGVDKSSATATVGGTISETYFFHGTASTTAITPKLGLDGSLALSLTRDDTGKETSSALLGIGLTAGVDIKLEGGLGLGLSTRVSRSGDTTGGSITGKISASF